MQNDAIFKNAIENHFVFVTTRIYIYTLTIIDYNYTFNFHLNKYLILPCIVFYHISIITIIKSEKDRIHAGNMGGIITFVV